jgi:hypothetical protein
VAVKTQSHEKQTQRPRIKIHPPHAASANRQAAESDVQDRWLNRAERAAIQQLCVSFDIFIAPQCMFFTEPLEHPSFAAIHPAI